MQFSFFALLCRLCFWFCFLLTGVPSAVLFACGGPLLAEVLSAVLPPLSRFLLVRVLLLPVLIKDSVSSQDVS